MLWDFSDVWGDIENAYEDTSDVRSRISEAYPSLAPSLIPEKIYRQGKRLFDSQDDDGNGKSEGNGMPEGIDFNQLWDFMIKQRDMYRRDLYPSSVEASMDTASKFFDFLSQQGDIADIRNIEKAMRMNYALAGLTEEANKFYRKQALIGNIFTLQQNAMLNEWSQGEINKSNEMISDIWNKSLEEALPNIKETGSAYKAAVDRMLEGDVPDDVVEQIQTSMAELGLSQGRFGEALSASTARSLGLSSLQMMQMGMQQVPQLTQTALALRTPYLMPQPTIPQLRTDVLYLPTPQFPSAAYVSPYDPAALQNTYLSGLMQTSIMSPNTYAQMLTSQYTAQLEYRAAQEANALNWKMFERQMGFNREQRWFDLAGGALGMASGVGTALKLGGLMG